MLSTMTEITINPLVRQLADLKLQELRGEWGNALMFVKFEDVYLTDRRVNHTNIIPCGQFYVLPDDGNAMQTFKELMRKRWVVVKDDIVTTIFIPNARLL